MCNEKNHRTCYIRRTYEVHTFKTKNKRIIKRHFLIIFSLLYLFIRSCKFIIETHTHDIAHDENTMSSLSIKVYSKVRSKTAVLQNFQTFREKFKYLSWSLFLIKNFKATLLKGDSNTSVFLWILQNF